MNKKRFFLKVRGSFVAEIKIRFGGGADCKDVSKFSFYTRGCEFAPLKNGFPSRALDDCYGL